MGRKGISSMEVMPPGSMPSNCRYWRYTGPCAACRAKSSKASARKPSSSAIANGRSSRAEASMGPGGWRFILLQYQDAEHGNKSISDLAACGGGVIGLPEGRGIPHRAAYRVQILRAAPGFRGAYHFLHRRCRGHRIEPGGYAGTVQSGQPLVPQFL